MLISPLDTPARLDPARDVARHPSLALRKDIPAAGVAHQDCRRPVMGVPEIARDLEKETDLEMCQKLGCARGISSDTGMIEAWMVF